MAIHHFEKALELLPHKTEFARNLALSYRLVHRYQEALTIYKRLLQQDPSDLQLLNETAQTSSFLREDQKAILLYHTALEQNSCSHDALNGLGHLYLKRLELKKAMQTFEQAVSCVPTDTYASFYLGKAFARAGLMDQAQVIWKNALERVEIRTRQEEELYHLMQKRTVNMPSLLSKTSSVPSTGKIPQASIQ